jgi:hypothetical protein
MSTISPVEPFTSLTLREYPLTLRLATRAPHPDRCCDPTSPRTRGEVFQPPGPAMTAKIQFIRTCSNAGVRAVWRRPATLP